MIFKKKLSLKHGIILALLLFLCTFVFLYIFNIPVYRTNNYIIQNQVNVEQQMTKEQVIADRQQIIEALESVHPIFLDTIPKKYTEAKKEFISSTCKAMTVYDFQILLTKYMSSLNDGHTELFYEEKWKLDVRWKYAQGKLVLLDKDYNITDETVVEINNVPVYTIAPYVAEMFPSENYVADNANISHYIKLKSVLQSCNIVCGDNVDILVRTEQGTEELRTIKFLEIKNDHKPIKSQDRQYDIWSKLIKPDTLYVKLESCITNDDFNKVIKDIKDARYKKTKKFIIDLRNNSGGEVKVSDKLFDALGIKPGNFGYLERYSPLLQKEYGYLKRSGYSIKESKNDVVKNNDIELYVIVNEYSFSTSMIIATITQDGGLGKVVGTPMSNMPSSYGDICLFQLNNSKLEGQISFTKWYRPDKSKDHETILTPDIEIKHGENPIDIILNNK